MPECGVFDLNVSAIHHNWTFEPKFIFVLLNSLSYIFRFTYVYGSFANVVKDVDPCCGRSIILVMWIKVF